MFKLYLPLFCCFVLLSGCDDATEIHGDNSQSALEEKHTTRAETQEEPVTSAADLKQGNFFYIARDVADMQLRAGDYIQQLKQSQNELEQAIQAKDQHQLQQTASHLEQQLRGLNRTLDGLSLKSQEIETIRQNVLAANQQVLASPFLNGQINWNKVDFAKVEQQINNIQVEMFKLAAMMIPQSDSSATQASEETHS